MTGSSLFLFGDCKPILFYFVKMCAVHTMDANNFTKNFEIIARLSEFGLASKNIFLNESELVWLTLADIFFMTQVFEPVASYTIQNLYEYCLHWFGEPIFLEDAIRRQQLIMNARCERIPSGPTYPYTGLTATIYEHGRYLVPIAVGGFFLYSVIYLNITESPLSITSLALNAVGYFFLKS